RFGSQGSPGKLQGGGVQVFQSAAALGKKMQNKDIPLTGVGPENGGLLFDDAGKIGDDFRFIAITTPEYGHFVRDTRRRKLDNVLVSDLNGGVGQDIVIGRIKQERIFRIGLQTRGDVFPVRVGRNFNSRGQVQLLVQVHKNTGAVQKGMVRVDETGAYRHLKCVY